MKALILSADNFEDSELLVPLYHLQGAGYTVEVAASERGRHATCYQAVADELREAGAKYSDSEVVVDSRLVTSRQPGDLPDFMRELMRRLPH